MKKITIIALCAFIHSSFNWTAEPRMEVPQHERAEYRQEESHQDMNIRHMKELREQSLKHQQKQQSRLNRETKPSLTTEPLEKMNARHKQEKVKLNARHLEERKQLQDKHLLEQTGFTLVDQNTAEGYVPEKSWYEKGIFTGAGAAEAGKKVNEHFNRVKENINIKVKRLWNWIKRSASPVDAINEMAENPNSNQVHLDTVKYMPEEDKIALVNSTLSRLEYATPEEKARTVNNLKKVFEKSDTLFNQTNLTKFDVDTQKDRFNTTGAGTVAIYHAQDAAENIGRSIQDAAKIAGQSVQSGARSIQAAARKAGQSVAESAESAKRTISGRTTTEEEKREQKVVDDAFGDNGNEENYND